MTRRPICRALPAILLALTGPLVAACATDTPAAARDRTGVCGDARLQAHRGGPDGPENSLAALQLAADSGFDAAEVDVQRLADGTWVLHHDAVTGRTVAGGLPQPVGTLTVDDWRNRVLKTRDGRTTQTAPPLLDHALSLASQRELPLNIEIKGLYGCSAVRALEAQVASALPKQQVQYSSVDPAALTCLDEVNDRSQLNLVVAPSTDAVAERHGGLLDAGKALADKVGIDRDAVSKVAKAAYDRVDNDRYLTREGMRQLSGELDNPRGLLVSDRAISRDPGLLSRAANNGLRVGVYAASSPQRQGSRLIDLDPTPDTLILDQQPRRFCRR